MIGIGERAPDFVLPRDGTPTRWYGTVGGAPSVLVLACGADAGRVVELAALAGDGVRTDVVVRRDGPAGAFVDTEGRVHGAFRADAEGPAVLVVLDANVRITATLTADAQDLQAALRDHLTAAQRDLDDPVVVQHAPVLLVPGALDDAWCDRLVELWASSETTETGVEASTGDGRGEVTDALRKRRRDLTVTDADLVRELTQTIGRRVLPELRKAFAYRANRFEGFKIGCYEDATSGFFAPHRDNLSPSTAHRRFALTLNLNDGYEGGELRFPEYGQQRYRPARGEALVFSGSHLHEVLSVTSGRRFVLLSFLFGDDAVRR